jgi:hypothetical protein
MPPSSGQINETSTEETREYREEANHGRFLTGPTKIRGRSESLNAKCT